MDILNDVRERIVAARTSTIERPPPNFDKPYNWKVGLAGGSAGTALGVIIGGSIGVAALGTAVSGAWVLAPILGIAGLIAGKPSKSDR